MARHLGTDPQSLETAAAALRAGSLVALPTETVYGLAADATNGEAVAAIFAAKGRPRFNPLICHVSSRAMAEEIATIDPLSARLMEAFWPGPLTLVLPLRQGAAIHPLATAGLSTVAIRMPRGIAREVIELAGRPLAAPSANPSGRVSPTTAEAVEAGVGDRIAFIIDGGPSAVGVESTILRVEGDRLTLLRPGGLPAGEIERVAGHPLVRRATGAAIIAPGMLASHYAPHAPVRIGAAELLPGEALLAFGPQRIAGAGDAVAILNLSPTGNLAEAAANLFSFLSRLDESDATAIAVEPIPNEGLGEAINDRLARAAAPRQA